MSRVDDHFRALRARGEKTLMPFVTAGDPSCAWTAALLAECARRGVLLAEVGFPYSDPIADGPVIQASYTRALGAGFKVEQGLALARPHREGMALVAMVSYSILHRMGLALFVDKAQSEGYAGIIVPDLLVEEAAPLRQVCRDRDFSLIHLVTPTTPRDRAVRIAESSSGFLYYVSVTGITGERAQLPPGLAENVAWLRERTPLPICIGFGISQPQQVQALAPVADGLIVGSAIVRRVEQARDLSPEAGARQVADYVSELASALAARPA
jgi:tryptophan synthase alpha chain